MGLSLPIDGSKDNEICIQGGEHLHFEPIRVAGLPQEGAIVFDNAEEKLSEVLQKSDCRLKSSGQRLEDSDKENIRALVCQTGDRKLRAKRARRVIPDIFFEVPKGKVDDYAFDRYSDH